MNILGIESSCDETAAAVVADGREILSSVVASQVDIHKPFGGVVPELASRKHVEAIVPVVREAIAVSGITEEQISAVAVTQGPGLVGALLVGFSFAKAYAYARDLPLVGIDHLQGHIASLYLSGEGPDFPFVALLVSGGHTTIYYVTSHLESHVMGKTRDDAAGEAFDKVSKLLGLGYPGGGVIGKFARNGDPKKLHFPRAFLDKSKFDFSFSGIKSAIRRYVQEHPEDYQENIADIAAGFQEAVVDVLTYKLIRAAAVKECRHLAVVGGVAANERLRERVREESAKEGIQVHIPPFSLCGDNAAMIAAAGYHQFIAGKRTGNDEDVYSRSIAGKIMSS